jgi:hypothetical protein
MAKRTKSRQGTPWTKKDLDYLSDHYGVLDDDTLAQRLGRTKYAIKVAVTRKLKGVRRTGTFYTARILSLVLGRKDSRAVALWISHGWLKATKGPPGAGRTQMWNITEDDIVALLERRPWLADMNRMEDHHYFSSIVRTELERDPWYTARQAAPRLGVKTREAVLRYIHKGWLLAEKEPGGPEHRVWVIRESAIRAFLRNDPRKKYKSELSRANKIESNIKLGIPVKLNTTWQLKCPSCGDQVTVTAPGWMLGYQVKEIFLASYTKGGCTHEDSCSIQSNYSNSNTVEFGRLALAGAIKG